MGRPSWSLMSVLFCCYTADPVGRVCQLQHFLQHRIERRAKPCQYIGKFELPVPSIIGAVEKRAACVAASTGIQTSPRGRRQLERTRGGHDTHTNDGLPPYPVQMQVDGGVWVGLPLDRGRRWTLLGRQSAVSRHNPVAGAECFTVARFSI